MTQVSARLPKLSVRSQGFIGGLATFLLLASWGYLLKMIWDMQHMDMSAMMNSMAMSSEISSQWNLGELAWLIMMWAVMMIAMMLPSALPMIISFAKINQKKQAADGSVVLPISGFVAGYLSVWTLFSVVAGLTQWTFNGFFLLSPMMVSSSPILGGTLLLGAGLFQFSPLKDRCLSHCRSPLGFLMSEYRAGVWGAFVMGLKHGSFCVGCCWILMALLFVGGVMNLVWIVGLAAYVLVEKMIPKGKRLSQLTGAALALWGIIVLVRPII